jgi:electron transport complex protein RnfD
MYGVVGALIPAMFMGVYLFGFRALVVVLVSVVVGMATEAGGQRMMGRKVTISDGSAMVTGILLALNLPPTVPWWLVVVGSAIAIVIGKQIYGGLGYNPFNPALVARVILLISFPVQMTSWVKPSPLFSRTIDAVTTATPLGEMKTHLMVKGTLEGFAMGDLWDPFLGNIGGCIGETSVIALLIGAGFLLYRGYITWHIPVTFVGTVFILSGLFWLINPDRYMNPVFHIVTGGLMLGAFYMATDMVTSPITNRGMMIFGVGCGVITIIIRLFGGYPEGVSYSILLMNAATPLIDRIPGRLPLVGERSLPGDPMKDILRLMVVLTSLCIVSALALAKIYDLTKGPIAHQKRLEVLRAIKTVLPPYDNEPDRDMAKLSMGIDKRGEETQRVFYRGRKDGRLIGVAFKVASPEGYGGDIEVMVGLLPNGMINGIEILSHLETPGLGAKIREAKFKDRFENRNLSNTAWAVKKDGGDIDGITGATISSRAVIKGVKEGLEFYRDHRTSIVGPSQ